MAVMKVGDTIMLENDDVFQVMEVVEYNGDSFLYAFKAADELVDMIDPKDLKTAFLKEVLDKEAEEVYVEQVLDAELVKILSQLVMEDLG